VRQADNPGCGKIYHCFQNRPPSENDCRRGGHVLIEFPAIVTARRLIVWIYAVLFLGVGMISGVFLFRTYQEYTQLQRLEAESHQRVAQARQRLEEQKRVLDRLQHDPYYVEKVIRQQLRYAKPSDLIFRFRFED
jgi:cell division protein FtsB